MSNTGHCLMDSSGAQARYIGTRMSNFQILLRQETIEGLVVKNWNLNRADTVLLFHFWFGFGRFSQKTVVSVVSRFQFLHEIW